MGVGKRYCKVQSGYLELEGANRPPMRIALRGMHLISAGWLTFKLIGQEYSLVFRVQTLFNLNIILCIEKCDRLFIKIGIN